MSYQETPAAPPPATFLVLNGCMNEAAFLQARQAEQKIIHEERQRQEIEKVAAEQSRLFSEQKKQQLEKRRNKHRRIGAIISFE
jgi:hypothetical protein